jgi:hypothetical protein
MKLKVIRCMAPRGGLTYAVRMVEQEGDIETDLYSFEHEDQAEHLVRLLSNISQRTETTLQAIAALLRIHGLAVQIGTATDQQGNDSYATKAHMRAWGEQIFNLATFALGSCGLDVKPDHIIVPRAGPAIAIEQAR